MPTSSPRTPESQAREVADASYLIYPGKSFFAPIVLALALLLSIAALHPNRVEAATAPTVELKEATAGNTTATLNATINPNEAETKYYFEYGLTKSYGAKTAEGSIPAGTKAVPKSAFVSSLLEGTQYHYRLVASNVAGVSKSGDATFATQPRWTNLGAWEKPSGASAMYVRGVSCVSTTWCMAVGDNNTTKESKNFTPLAESWKGGSWSLVSMPAPKAVKTEVEKVSCVSTTFCIAVGTTEAWTAEEHPWGETWDGTKWSLVTLPEPSNGVSGDLTDISCVSITACVAVGTYYTNTGAKLGLAMRWNGSTWSAEAIPAMPGAAGVPPYAEASVSCVPKLKCTFVGSYLDSKLDVVAYASDWNEEFWMSKSSYNPKGAIETRPGSISCTAESRCVAVGTYVESVDEFPYYTKFLEESESLNATLVAEKDSEHLTLLTRLVGLTVSITCTGLELINAKTATGGKMTTGYQAKFTGCNAYKSGSLTAPFGCIVHSSGEPTGTIITKKLKGELTLYSGEVLVKIEPETGTALATVRMDECSLPEVDTVNGVLFLKDGQKAATAHLERHLVEQGLLTVLWVGADTAEHLTSSIDGGSWVKLGGEHAALAWGAMDAEGKFSWLVVGAESGPLIMPEANEVGGMSAIACPSTERCLSPGGGLPDVFIDALWGGTWSVQAIPEGGPFNEGGLADISCTSTQFCVVVGEKRSAVYQ